MNQILINGNSNLDINNVKKSKNIFRFHFIFILSIFFLLSLIIYIFYHNNQIMQKNNISKRMLDNFEISRLYGMVNSTPNNSSYLQYNENSGNFDIIGIIKIESLNLNYPILSNYSNNLLKIAPCRISGPFPNEVGNLCIAAHNYNNSTYFSNIDLLKINDKITIYDSNGNFLDYYIYKTYESNYNDLSCMENTNYREITLITCNNLNSNKRIIVKAKERS